MLVEGGWAYYEPTHSRGGSVMGWCHSFVFSLPQPILLSIPGDTTRSSFLFPIVFHFVLANSCPAKPKLLWQGDGLVGGWRAIHRSCPLCLFHFIVASSEWINVILQAIFSSLLALLFIILLDFAAAPNLTSSWYFFFLVFWIYSFCLPDA